jgi:DNA adenine methylase
LIENASEDDFIYCDPPYIDRYNDYFNSWNEYDENRLCVVLSQTKAKFLLSTWRSNKYRENVYIKSLWSGFNIDAKEHFYHLGASEKNRNSMTEALISNFVSDNTQKDFSIKNIQLPL